jgi:hypothetical protein
VKASLHTSAESLAPAYDPRVCAYIAVAPTFAKPILEHIREIVHKANPEIEETIKWSRPFFMHRGVILGNMSTFTAHCSFGLWGAGIGGVLRNDGIDGSDSSGSFGRLTSVKDLPPDDTLIGYVQQAVALSEKAPKKSATASEAAAKPAAKAEIPIPPELMAALEAKPLAKSNFAALSPSCRREYLAWIAEAKRPETRDRRIATTVQQVAEGKALHWKYA